MKPLTFTRIWVVCLLACIGIACQRETTWSLPVITLAGGGASGYLDGPVDSVVFLGPESIAVHPFGEVFVTDQLIPLVRKIVPGGTVVVVAGSRRGYADGAASLARFDTPRGLVLDAEGNLYVADQGNHRIRKITPGGEVSTLAGNGNPGFEDGVGEAAGFNHPTGLAIDSRGHLYVADAYNHSIRKLSPTGEVSTLAGQSIGFADGKGRAAGFNDPVAIALDASGNLYVADRGNHSIRKITPDGEVSTLAGDGTPGFADGSGEQARFDHPSGIAADKSGNLYIGDSENNRIRRVTPAGVVTTLAGDGTAGFADGPATVARFSHPAGVALDPRGEFLFIADKNNRRIRRIDLR